MLKKSEGPSEAKLFFDARAVPLAANLAGSLEVALERASVRSGIRPSLILAVCLGAGVLGVLGLVRNARTAQKRVP